jgi:hypothetical protein
MYFSLVLLIFIFVEGNIFISDSSASDGACSYDIPCQTISHIIGNSVFDSQTILIKNSFTCSENLTFSKNCYFDGVEKNEFNIGSTFYLTTYSIVSFKNIKFIISANHLGSSNNARTYHQIFASTSNGENKGTLIFEDCDLNASDTTNTIKIRLFTINATLTLKNVKIENMLFNTQALGIDDPQAPIYIPASGNASFESVVFRNFSKTSVFDMITQRHNGEDFKNCIFDNIEHPGLLVSLWFDF